MNSKEKRFWGEFLDLYRSMPCLWKVKSADYSNRRLKGLCYDKMVQKLSKIDPEANREKVVKKINVFRTNYKRALKMGRTPGASTLWYFNKLKFLENQDGSTEEQFTMDTENLKTESAEEKVEKPPAKKQKVPAKDNLVKISCPKLTNTDDATSVFAKGWEAQYAELSQAQKVFTRMIFADVLFHGCLNKLTEQAVEDIHKVLQGVSTQSHTQYIDEYTADTSQSSSSPSVEHFEEQLFSPPPNDE